MKKKFILVSLLFLYLLNTNVFAEKQDKLFEKIDLFSEVLEKISNEYVDEVDKADVMDDAINGVLQSLDPYSAYMSPEIYSYAEGVHDKFCSFCPDRDTSCFSSLRFSLLSSLFSLLSSLLTRVVILTFRAVTPCVTDHNPARPTHQRVSQRRRYHAPRCRPSRLCGAAPALLHVWCRSTRWLRRCGRSRRTRSRNRRRFTSSRSWRSARRSTTRSLAQTMAGSAR